MLNYDIIQHAYKMGLVPKFEKAGLAPSQIVDFASIFIDMALQIYNNSYEYHKDGESPDVSENYVFVFGSNLAGIHGAGAAREALEKFGARIGVGEGMMGMSYALPTKDDKIESLPINKVGHYIAAFKFFAYTNPERKFFLTRVGCGLAGFKDEEIAPLFVGSPDNINFPEEWKKYISCLV